ncbi:hypothetical protein CHARACLAT_032456 [Characodon lateralis]|uniref:Uncharacterized protein n=1 Tax=Characodon lateralis TaxID=208331 RepID=A0ABU7EGJ9_9TELE|nr:hypothetical protein [Characodon lateralis]
MLTRLRVWRQDQSAEHDEEAAWRQAMKEQMVWKLAEQSRGPSGQMVWKSAMVQMESGRPAVEEQHRGPSEQVIWRSATEGSVPLEQAV